MNKSQLELARAKKTTRDKARTLYLAKAKHKAMKKTFKGIYSYPTRTSLFKVGQKNGK